jgi:hypothetical protein|tara:strand:+ start:1265 stop:1399 length:135 start_codon:yes stop_codon:yes gene_type:complete
MVPYIYVSLKKTLNTFKFGMKMANILKKKGIKTNASGVSNESRN